VARTMGTSTTTDFEEFYRHLVKIDLPADLSGHRCSLGGQGPVDRVNDTGDPGVMRRGGWIPRNETWIILAAR